MKKIALLIGVGEYASGLSPLPNASNDVEAMKRILSDPLMGEFNDVKTLINPDRQKMESEIEALFADRDKSDLTLFYFTGHGIKNDRGDLYLGTNQTRKSEKGELVKSTAVAADYVHKIMSDSRSKRQVVILDCCFSGAFAEGMTAKDDGMVDIQAQLGAEGRAVLASSTSTQYSFEYEGSELSLYTRYLVEGLETGAADLDRDGVVSVDELHEYAKTRVQETAPAMKPEIYAAKEGFRIFLSHATPSDPQLRYRREVQRCANRGEISDIARTALESLRRSLNITPETAAQIEDEVLEPSREHQKNLRQYEQSFLEAVWREDPLCDTTRNDLKYLQRILGLREEDVRPLEARVLSRKAAMQSGSAPPPPSVPAPTPPLADLKPPPPPSAMSAPPPVAKPTEEVQFATPAKPKAQPPKRGLAIALWSVVIGLGLAGGGYGYWRWQRYQDTVAMNQTTAQTLSQAEQQFVAGDLNGAIATLNSISPNSDRYSEAQEKATAWQLQWNADQATFNEIRRVLQVDDTNGAQDFAKQLLTPYWQAQASQVITEAQNRVAANLGERAQNAEIARQRAEQEAEAARRAAATAQAEAEREHQIQMLLSDRPIAGATYRITEPGTLNVRSAPNREVIGGVIGELPYDSIVRVTGQQRVAQLNGSDIVWAEISEPVSGWVSRRQLAGPITEAPPAPVAPSPSAANPTTP